MLVHDDLLAQEQSQSRRIRNHALPQKADSRGELGSQGRRCRSLPRMCIVRARPTACQSRTANQMCLWN
jgi:hypothetical protein